MRALERSTFTVLIAGIFVLGGCTGDSTIAVSTDTTEPATSTTEPTSSSTTESTEAPTSTTTTIVVATVEIVDGAGLSQPDATWAMRQESFFVWGVEADDVLNVRAGAGVNNSIVATIGPGLGGLRIYDQFDYVGNSNWVPIEIGADGAVGWVSDRFLRPDPPLAGPVIVGTPTPEVLELVAQAIEGLNDASMLAALVGPDGLTVSPSAYVGDDAVTLTQDQMVNQADVDRVWGITAGKGDEIVATLDQYLEGLTGRTALTSTAEIGYGVTLGGGNSINNLEDVFPGATVVEYYHPGTQIYGGIDWTALRFVLETEADQLVLRALISDQWEI